MNLLCSVKHIEIIKRFKCSLYYGIDYNVAKINKNITSAKFQRIILQKNHLN